MQLDFDKCLGLCFPGPGIQAQHVFFSGGGAGLAEEIFWWALLVPAYRICVLAQAK